MPKTTAERAHLTAERAESHLSDKRWIEPGKSFLAAVWEIGVRGVATTHSVEACDLFGTELPTDRAEVIPQLLLVSGTDDDG